MPRALQDRGICGLIAVQPALVVQHEWPEDETEFPVVRASRVLSQRCGMHGAHGMRDIEAQMACMAHKWHGWHGWRAWHACMACLSFGRLSNMQIVPPFNKLNDPLQHKFPAHASAY